MKKIIPNFRILKKSSILTKLVLFFAIISLFIACGDSNSTSSHTPTPNTPIPNTPSPTPIPNTPTPNTNTPTPIPNTPTLDLQVSQVGNSLHLDWNELEGAKSYQIYHSTSNSTSDATLVAVVDRGQTYFIDTNPVDGVYYFVVAISEDREITRSRTGNAIEIVESSALPNPPTNLRAIQTGGDQVRLDWDATIDNNGAIGFQIYRDNERILSHPLHTNSRSYRDENVPVGNHTYRITNIISSSLESAFSNEALLSIITPPFPPQNIRAQQIDGVVELSWSASIDLVLGYKVYRYVEGQRILIATTNSSTTSILDGNVVAGTSYIYNVFAYNLAGEASPGPVTITITDFFPSNDLNLQMTQIGESVYLDWDATTGALYYNIYRSTINFFPQSSLIASTDSEQTYYLDVNTLPGISYYYAVSAITNTGEPMPLIAPLAPQNFRARQAGNGVELSWSEPEVITGGIVQEYRVYKQDILIAITDSTSIRDSSIDVATTYSYRVSAYNLAGETSSVPLIITSSLADRNNNGLIEIDNLTQLHNIRFNLQGTSYKDSTTDIGNTLGCPSFGCSGYELTTNLDFDLNRDGSSWSTVDSHGEISYQLDYQDHNPLYFPVDSIAATGGWLPIRDFDASFEGNGFIIYNLAIRRDNIVIVGLFGLKVNASIRNLGLVNYLANYTGNDDSWIFVGGLVGFSKGTIVNSYAMGHAYGGNGDRNLVGGLVGNNEGHITNSYAMGKVGIGDGEYGRIGGLVGNNEGHITNSYAMGTVAEGNGNSGSIGGLAGYNRGPITNSYTTGKVNAGDGDEGRIGGLAGDNVGLITASYATGKVDASAGSSEYVGGLIGTNFGTITNSYATGSANGGGGDHNYVGGLVGYNDNNGAINGSSATGDAYGGDVDYSAFGGLVGINLGIITTSDAVGNAYARNGIFIHAGGLVGSNHGTITTSYATGKAKIGAASFSNAGGLVGRNNGTITTSYATGKAQTKAGLPNAAGGLVGQNWKTIIASYATGNAEGGSGIDYVGGLVGNNFGIIIASYAMGNAYGEDGGDEITGGVSSVGGLVGFNSSTSGFASGTIIASYAMGNAYGGNGGFGIDGVGGLVGYNLAGTITASYAMGNAYGGPGADGVGGLVGKNYYRDLNSTIIASYAMGNADGGDGTGDGVGALVGFNSSNIFVRGSDTIVASYGFGSSINGEISGVDANPDIALANLQELMETDVDDLETSANDWNDASLSTLGVWDFGGNTQAPALLFNDYDGAGIYFRCGVADSTGDLAILDSTGDLIPNTDSGDVNSTEYLIPNCGLLIPGQR